MPVADRAPYLGTNMSAKGNPHFELSTRIISTTATLNKLGLFWKKAPVSITWKLRVHDAVIISKLLYGLESASLTNAEYERFDAFQIKALRKMLGITHPIPLTRKQRSGNAHSQLNNNFKRRKNDHEDVRNN